MAFSQKSMSVPQVSSGPIPGLDCPPRASGPQPRASGGGKGVCSLPQARPHLYMNISR